MSPFNKIHRNILKEEKRAKKRAENRQMEKRRLELKLEPDTSLLLYKGRGVLSTDTLSQYVY